MKNVKISAHHTKTISMRTTHQNISDRLLTEFDRMLKVLSHQAKITADAPDHGIPEPELSEKQVQHIGGLMRINHTGEVCAQALYNGQAMMARDQDTRKHLLQAASEEQAHLNWCQARLDELGEETSKTNAFWYLHSFAVGSLAALFGDPVSYGFVIETERQVESHLQDHMDDIGGEDPKSLSILKQMQADEIKHGQAAHEAGGTELPMPVKTVMTAMSQLMKFVSYRI